MKIDSILMIGFGGPTSNNCKRHTHCPYENAAECFVAGVLGDDSDRIEQIKDVAANYRHFNGISPYNELSSRQARALEEALSERGHNLPIYICFRHSSPDAADILSEMAHNNHRNIGLMILAPHQCSVSWGWYIKTIADAIQVLDDGSDQSHLNVTHVFEPWWNNNGFIDANANNITTTVTLWDQERFTDAALVFTAHSIPDSVSKNSHYEAQFRDTAQRVANACGHPDHHVSYQSSPRNPDTRWSGPDIKEKISQLAKMGTKEIVVQAAGFLVDNIEVLHDLDIVAQNHAQMHDITYHRAPCVHSHSAFINGLAVQVEAIL